MPKILIVDEEVSPADYYIRNLRSHGIDTTYCSSVDEAYKLIQRRGTDFAVIILDIMMPPETRYKDFDTDEGIQTGTLLFSDVRKELPDVPVIILTNVSNPNIINLIDQSTDIEIYQKMDTVPSALSKIVLNKINHSVSKRS
jgi:CheY-like chemotaxis protein